MRTAAVREFRRLLVFFSVGALNFAVTYVLFAALVQLGWHYNLALAASYIFSIGFGYLLHRGSTFADREHVRQGFGKYAISVLLAFLVNLALLDWIVGRGLLAPLSGQAVAMSLATLFGYQLQTHWVFRSRRRPNREEIRQTPVEERRKAA
ncbi:MAG: GtrA family protein [Planctomycetota bacterium]|nr:MAG: GtrA family protein [Planctomycetota bacterium]